MPTLRADRLAAGFLYWDARSDDARLTLAVLRTAVLDHGATAANHTRVTGLVADDDGRVCGATVHPTDGEPFTVHASVVVNAAGVWSDEVRTLDEHRDPRSIRPAKGIHITVPEDAFPCDIAAVIPVKEDKRSIFVVSWGDQVYLGTTDTAWDGPLDDPSCTPEDVEYILDAANAVSTRPLTRSDITGIWSGLRPLLAPEQKGGTQRAHGRPVASARGADVRARDGDRHGRQAHHLPQDGGGHRRRRRVGARSAGTAVPDQAPPPARCLPRRPGRPEGGRRRVQPAVRPVRPGRVEDGPSPGPVRDRVGGGPGHGRRGPRAPRTPGGRPALPDGRGPVGRPTGDGPLGVRRPGPPDPVARTATPAPPPRPPPGGRADRARSGVGRRARAGRGRRLRRAGPRPARAGRAGPGPGRDRRERWGRWNRRGGERRGDGRMTAPTPVTPVDADPADIVDRLGGSGVPVDDGLARRLADACDHVSTLDGDRADAARDWWPLAIGWAAAGSVPARPALVARPTDTAQVAAVLALCDAARVPVTAAGGRSGVCGASIPLFGGVALDLCGLAGIGEVDDESLVADVRAGTFGPDVEAGLRAHGLTLGHWPQSMDLSTVGGWLACRGAGQYSNRYGKIEDMVIGLEVVLGDGRIVRTGGHGPRSATGPDLTQLFVGSEGTLGVITEGRFRVHPVPAGEGRRAFGFPSFADGLDACRRVLRRGASPAVLRLYDATESGRSFDRPDTCVLIVLDEADPALLDATLDVVDQECADAVPLDDALVERWLGHRNDVSALAPLWRSGVVVDTVEVSGRWSALPGLYRSVLDALGGVPGTLVASSHQSHAYTDGACLYVTFAGRPPDELSAEPGARDAWIEEYYRRAWDEVTGATIAAGGAISHHHGIGLNRGRFLAEALGPAFAVLASVKAALDPHGILNPGKLGLGSPFGPVTWP